MDDQGPWQVPTSIKSIQVDPENLLSCSMGNSNLSSIDVEWHSSWLMFSSGIILPFIYWGLVHNPIEGMRFRDLVSTARLLKLSRNSVPTSARCVSFS